MCDIRSDLVVVVQRLPSIIWIQLIMVLRPIGTLYTVLSADSLFQKLRKRGASAICMTLPTARSPR